MGFSDAMSGYKKVKNTKGYSNEELLSKLQEVTFPFGTPELGNMKKKETILFSPAIGRMLVFVRADKKVIEIGTVAAPGHTGGVVLKELGASILTDVKAQDQAEANRAVEEIYSVIKNLVETGEVQSASLGNDNIKLYMREKLFSIKDKYYIYNENEEPIYTVSGNLLSLKYKIEDASGKEIFEVHKKLVAIMPEYTLHQDGKKICTLEKKLKLLKPEISGKVGKDKLQIKGDFSGFNFTIYIGNKIVGSVDPERLTWGGVYAISIRDKELQDLIVAIAVVVQNMLKDKED